MVKHIILWQLKDELSTTEKSKIKSEMKRELESLVGVVPGLIELEVNYNAISSSNAEVMLYSVLESEEALKGYAVHPAHVAVADNFVRPFVKTRLCFDTDI